MRKDYIFLSLLFVSLALGGCASFKGYPTKAVDPAERLKTLGPYLRLNLADYDKLPADEQRRKRGEIVNAEILATDLHFAAFQEMLYKEGVEYSVGTSWTVIALTEAASLVGGGSGRALSATAGGLVGAKEAFDKNVYFKKTMPVLLAEMVARRKKVLVRIRSGLAKDINEYPLTQALVDLEDYYQAGTIPGAIMEIAETAGVTTKEADSKLEKILAVPYGEDENSKLLRKYLEWDGKQYNLERKEELKKWIDEHKELTEKPPVPAFVTGGPYSIARTEAVAHLIGGLTEDENSKRLEKFLEWDGKKFDQGKLVKLRTWMEGHGLKEVPVLLFLGKNEYADERIKALKSL